MNNSTSQSIIKSSDTDTLKLTMVNVIIIPTNILGLRLNTSDSNETETVQYVYSGRFYAITGINTTPNINNKLIKSGITAVLYILQIYKITNTPVINDANNILFAPETDTSLYEINLSINNTIYTDTDDLTTLLNKLLTQYNLSNNIQNMGGFNRRKKLLNKTKQKLKGHQRKTKTSKRLRR